MDAGEKFDLLIMPTPALAALDTAGKLAAGTRRALVRVGIGIAIREGAPKPDITTPDALRKTLLAQQKVTYSDSSTGGLSGINAQKVLQNLGIADEMKSKVLPHSDGQGLIAKGEADLGLYNVSEIPRAKGVVLLGPVPAAVQAYITYDAGVPAGNASPSAAIEFLKFIASPAAAPSWRAAGHGAGRTTAVRLGTVASLHCCKNSVDSLFIRAVASGCRGRTGLSKRL